MLYAASSEAKKHKFHSIAGGCNHYHHYPVGSSNPSDNGKVNWGSASQMY